MTLGSHAAGRTAGYRAEGPGATGRSCGRPRKESRRPWPDLPRRRSSGDRVAFDSPSEVLIWSRESGPRRYDIVHRVWKTTGRVLVHVVQQEHALAESREDADRSPRDRDAPDCRAFQPVEHARLVAFGLQPAEEPGADVRRAPCSRGRPDSASREPRRARTRAPCFSSVSSGAFDGGLATGGKIARQSRPCRAIARRLDVPVWPRIQPSIWLSSSETKNIRSASPRCAIEKTRRAACPSARVEQARRVERLSVEPLLETRRGKHAVEAHRQIEAIALREERLQVHDADLL